MPFEKTCAKNISKEKIQFPKKELNAWLKGRKNWTHSDWLSLLDDLKSKGFGSLLSSQEGIDSIGNYLEANK